MKICLSAAALLLTLATGSVWADNPERSATSNSRLSENISQAIRAGLNSERSAARNRLAMRAAIGFDRFTGLKSRNTFLITALPGHALIPDEEEPLVLGNHQQPVK